MCVSLDKLTSSVRTVELRFKLKSRQIRMLRYFAKMMKWPNLAETVANLKRRDADSTLGTISSHAMAFFSGLILPGVGLPPSASKSQPSLSLYMCLTIGSRPSPS